MDTKLASARLAIHGGPPIRKKTLPYGRQSLDDQDIAAVADALRSDWLTTGPKVAEFEQAFAEFTSANHAVAVSNGTAALHAAVAALEMKPGDEAIVPPMTFAASANCLVYQGAKPVFVDVDPQTLLLDASLVEAAITPRTVAIVAVDYAGQPADYAALREIAARHRLSIIGDAAHSLGASESGAAVGTLADLTTFSLHPVKLMTTGEGGVITTNDAELAKRMRAFRSHGITTDHREREREGSWYYEMVALGYNYRITDFQCALGITQLAKVPKWLERRQQIAAMYDAAFATAEAIEPLSKRASVNHAYHLYVVQLKGHLEGRRARVFAALRAEGIGVNVHYVPVHLHPFYRNTFGTGPGLAPVTEAAYENIITLPIFPAMTDDDVRDVIGAVEKIVACPSL